MEPKFEDYMLPILKVMSDGVIRSNGEIRSLVLEYIKLDPSILTEKQKSGNFKYRDNINFAISYLSMAGCLSRQKMGVYKISELGLSESKNNLDFIDVSYFSSI